MDRTAFSLPCDVDQYYMYNKENSVLFSKFIPYSGNLSRVKTFANFAVFGQFVKVLTTKIFIEYGGIIINGRVIVVSHNS